MKERFELEQDVNIKLEKVKGDEEQYDAWSTRAVASLGEEEKFEKTIVLNVLKGGNHFKKDDEGVPLIHRRLKSKYKKLLAEDEEFEISSQRIEEEKESKNDVVGRQIKV